MVPEAALSVLLVHHELEGLPLIRPQLHCQPLHIVTVESAANLMITSFTVVLTMVTKDNKHDDDDNGDE